MRFLKLARHWFWLAPLVLGIVFIGGGLYMIAEGRSAKDEVRDAIVRENITTSEDASIPNVRVVDAATAESEANVIQTHALEMADGQTYAELGRFMAADGGYTSDPEKALKGSDGKPVPNPVRNTVLQSVSLRTALNLAVMGFKISDLVVGMGFFMVAIGGTFILFMAPAVYWAAEIANERAATREKTFRGTAAPTA